MPSEYTLTLLSTIIELVILLVIVWEAIASSLKGRVRKSPSASIHHLAAHHRTVRPRFLGRE